MRKVDRCHMDKFGTLDSSEETNAVLGRWWPQEAEEEEETTKKNIFFYMQDMEATC